LRPVSAALKVQAMAITFDAQEVSITEEFGVHIIALSGATSGDDDLYLMVQYQDSYTSQDVQLGMAEPYIELCGQGWSWYGHIDRFELRRDCVWLQMDTHAASEMKNDGEFEVRFVIGDGQFDELRTALTQAFSKKTCFHENF
jgi:hypothetical protein